ncbi:E3 SUMO-protein ligase ZBED1-like [Diabrotica undecimpunctata]|uniref:E3 SUMO-protein ligase ZBED1-like n=1 Tax=Diabrotica undecimpunctata TaxID=50387 RepID=UPI003B639593
MPQKKSEIWTYFSDEIEGKVKCVYCAQTLSVKNKSTSTLIRHMNQKHPTLLIKRQKTEQAIRSTPANEGTVETIASTSSEVQTQPSSTLSTFQVSKLQTITGFFQRPLAISKQNEIDKQLIRMITKEYHPFSIVEDTEFKKLLYLLNPNYKVPSRKTVSNSMIPAFYNQTVDIVRTRLERAYAVCLTTDGWTSRTNDSFFSVTAYYIVEEDKRTFLTSDLLGCISFTERHTAENICNMLKQLISE